MSEKRLYEVGKRERLCGNRFQVANRSETLLEEGGNEREKERREWRRNNEVT